MPHAASVAATVIIQAWTWALPTAVTAQTGGDERCKRMRFRIAKVRKKNGFLQHYTANHAVPDGNSRRRK